MTKREFMNAIPLSLDFYHDPSYNEVRRANLIILSDVLATRETFKKMSQKKQTNMLRDIEASCVNAAIRIADAENIRKIWSNPSFTYIYSGIFYRVITNLDPSSDVGSDWLITKLESGEIAPFNLGYMSSRELCPVKYKDIASLIGKKNNTIARRKFNEAYQCNKCKERKCITEKRYNRSLDESINLTVICTFCGHSWNKAT